MGIVAKTDLPLQETLLTKNKQRESTGKKPRLFILKLKNDGLS